MPLRSSVSSPSAPGIRASDAEREAVGRILEAAAGEGRLTPEEAGERLAAVGSARYRDELIALTMDLPPPVDTRRLHPSTRVRLARGLFQVVAFGALIFMFWGLAGIRFFMPMWGLGLIVFIVAARARRIGWEGHWRQGWRRP